jgi:hypothetical protein
MNNKVIKLLPSQRLQQRITGITLRDMTKEQLIEYAEMVLEQYMLTFNQVRADYLRYRMNVADTDPMLQMFYETREEKQEREAAASVPNN